MKKVLYLIAGVVGLLLVVSLLSPKSIQDERSIVIKAPKEIIFEQVKYLKNHENWSPWKDKDPQMKNTFTGEDGTVGAASSWQSTVKGVGNGTQTIASIVENESVETDLLFDGQGKAKGFIRLKDTTDGVQVTWGFHADVPVPFNLMLLLPAGDDAGRDFEAGLQKLKALCESKAAETAPTADATIREISFIGKVYLGLRGTTTLDQVSNWYGASIVKVMNAAQSHKAVMTGPPGGLYFSWDDQKSMRTEMAAVVPVAASVNAGSDFQTIEIKPSKALQVDYTGGYYGSGAVHMAMDEYIKKHGYQHQPPVIEEYLSAMPEEPDSNKWVTRIIYLVSGGKGD